MEKIGRAIVKIRIPILVASFLLLIPAAFGYIKTRVNYDILYYLPKEIDTMQGQDILLDEFQKGAYAILITEGIEGNDLNQLEDKIADIDGAPKLWRNYEISFQKNIQSSFITMKPMQQCLLYFLKIQLQVILRWRRLKVYEKLQMGSALSVVCPQW